MFFNRVKQGNTYSLKDYFQVLASLKIVVWNSDGWCYVNLELLEHTTKS